tara:strand:- start:2588 stop:2836 length:249 start_codon:yes stop_codon:yes gene_type:complete
MDYKVRASRSKALMQNEHFQLIMKDLQNQQLEGFANSSADEVEKREDAHAILRALKQIEYLLQADINAEILIEKKDRHRHDD